MKVVRALHIAQAPHTHCSFLETTAAPRQICMIIFFQLSFATRGQMADGVLPFVDVGKTSESHHSFSVDGARCSDDPIATDYLFDCSV